MKKRAFVVFDDYVPSTSTVYTSQSLNDELGRYDHLSLYGTVDQQVNSTSAGTITVALEHSGDARLWNPKNALAEINGASTGNSGAQVTVAGADTSVNPSLAFVRLAITLAGVTTAAHVRLRVVARDAGK